MNRSPSAPLGPPVSATLRRKMTKGVGRTGVQTACAREQLKDLASEQAGRETLDKFGPGLPARRNRIDGSRHRP